MSWAHDNRDGNDGYQPKSRRSAPYNRDGGARGARVAGIKLKISGLRPAYTWQELKEAFSDAGAVARADVDGEGGGFVTFREAADAAWAIKNWNGVKFAGKPIKIVKDAPPAAEGRGAKGGRGAKEGGRGAKEGGRGAKGGRGRDKDEKPATAKDLESQMDSYFAKTEKGKAKVAEEKVASKAKVAENLDSDLDSFMAKRAEAAPAAAAETADAPAATEAAADTA